MCVNRLGCELAWDSIKCIDEMRRYEKKNGDELISIIAHGDVSRVNDLNRSLACHSKLCGSLSTLKRQLCPDCVNLFSERR